MAARPGAGARAPLWGRRAHDCPGSASSSCGGPVPGPGGGSVYGLSGRRAPLGRGCGDGATGRGQPVEPALQPGTRCPQQTAAPSWRGPGSLVQREPRLSPHARPTCGHVQCRASAHRGSRLTGKTACVARGDGAVVSRATVVGGGRDRGGPGSRRLRGSVWPEACGGRGRGCLRALGRPAGASLQPPASVAPPRCAFNPLLGQLVEFLKKHESKGPLSCDTILKIFYQVCRAVQHMHRQKPPIIHRDLKVPPPGGRAPRAPRGPGALPVREAAAASTLEPLTSLCSSSPEPGGRFR